MKTNRELLAQYSAASKLALERQALQEPMKEDEAACFMSLLTSEDLLAVEIMVHCETCGEPCTQVDTLDGVGIQVFVCNNSRCALNDGPPL